MHFYIITESTTLGAKLLIQHFTNNNREAQGKIKIRIIGLLTKQLGINFPLFSVKKPSTGEKNQTTKHEKSHTTI